MSFTKFPKTRRILSAIAGVLYIWIVVGCVFSKIFYPRFYEESGSDFYNFIWQIAIELPRAIITPIYITGVFIRELFSTLDYGYLYEIQRWGVISLPIIFIILFPGGLYWWKKKKLIFWTGTLIILVFVLERSINA